jgi:hypothetical protein
MHRMNVWESWLKAPNQAVVIQRVPSGDAQQMMGFID